MNGTEKQIAWATDIQSKVLNGRNAQINDGMYFNRKSLASKIAKREQKIANGKKTNIENLQGMKAELEMFDEMISRVENCDSAKWFIENQSELFNYHPCSSGIK